MSIMKTLIIFGALFCSSAWGQSDCNPNSTEDAQVVDRSPLKTIIGLLTKFDPSHKLVKLYTPSFFALKRGKEPPLQI